MKDLMEKYYNMIYYCAYKILFYFLYRLINPFYWIRLKRWNNNYINRVISISKKIEADAAHKGVILWVADYATVSVCHISLWIIAVICLIGIQSFKNKKLIDNCFYPNGLFFLPIMDSHRLIYVLYQ